MKKTFKTQIALVLASLAFSSHVVGADADGNFAIEGAGTQSCAAYLTVRESRSRDYYVFAGWVDGYLTSANQYWENTYDLTPWQSLELVMSALAKRCEDNAEKPFINVVNETLVSLTPGRLKKNSEVISVQNEGKRTFIYKDVLIDVQQRLAALDLYSGEPTGAYSASVRDAMADFQRAEELSVTGLPDQMTLFHLYRKSSQQSGDAAETASE